MDKSVLLKTAMLLSLCPQRHAESLVTTHRWHFLSKSSSHWYPHPYMWAGIPHSSQENTPCSLSPLESGMQGIELKVGANSIVIDQSGITLKGLMINLEGTVMSQIKAPMVQVKADGMLMLKGGLTMIG